MLQEFALAPRRAVSPLYVHVLALLALIAGVMAAVPPAFGQAMQAAVSVYRPTASKYFFDGNFDHVAEFKMVFGAPGLDVGLLGDLAGSGTRYPVLYRSGAWYVDSTKDSTVDQSFFFGGARQ